MSESSREIKAALFPTKSSQGKALESMISPMLKQLEMKYDVEIKCEVFTDYIPGSYESACADYDVVILDASIE